MANTVTAHTHRGKALHGVPPPARSTATPPRLTRVCGRDDGAEEEAVGVVELVRQLSGHLHQPDHAVHQVPNVKQGQRVITGQTRGEYLRGGDSPDDEAGDGRAQKGVGEDGAQVAEKESLKKAEPSSGLSFLHPSQKRPFLSRLSLHF